MSRRRASSGRLRLVLFTACLLLSASGAAQQWTVQTAAFGDHRQAKAQVEELRALGFDAYTEFAMNGGKQFSRVRVGCLASHAIAHEFASQLRGNVTAEAVPQELVSATGPATCVDWEVGFMKPDDWEVVRRADDIVFRVSLDGVEGYLRHDGSGWTLLRELPAGDGAENPTTSSPGGRFEEERVLGMRLVQAHLPGGQVVNVCGGELLWQGGNAAVVERADSVIACVIHESPIGGVQ